MNPQNRMTTTQQNAWWLTWDDEGRGFRTKTVTFNGKKSVTTNLYGSEDKRGPTKACGRLNYKRTDITLPNGTKTWFVLWGEDFGKMETAEDAEKWALTGHGVFRGQTPLDRHEVRVSVTKTKAWVGAEWELKVDVSRVFLWGGCVPLWEKSLESVKLPRRGADTSTMSAEVRAWTEQRNELCRAITEAAFHPDRVARMEERYGDEWDDAFHTHNGIGTGDPKGWEKRQKKEKDEREQARQRRLDAMMWD